MHGLGDGVEVGDIAVDDGIPLQILDTVPLQTISFLAALGKFDHLDGGRADVQTQERPRFGIEDREVDLQDFPFQNIYLARLRIIYFRCYQQPYRL